MTPFERTSVLIVENNRQMRQIIRQILIAFRVPTILEAKSVSKARRIINHARIDLVILDFFLDTLDGADFTRAVRWDPRCINRTVPILLLTAMPNHRRVLKMRDAGVNDILAKPIAPRALYAHMHTVLTAPREFIVSTSYVGPCRRRRAVDFPAHLERRRDRLEKLRRARVSNIAYV